MATKPEPAPDDDSIDAAAAYEAAMPLARFRDPHQLADGRGRIIGYQAPRRRDEAPILLPVEMVARAVAPEFHKIDGPALLSLLTPWPSAGKRPDWYVESPTRAADREARDRARREEVIPPKAIDWRRGQIEIDGMVFTECRVILAEDLAGFALAPDVADIETPPPSKDRLTGETLEGKIILQAGTGKNKPAPVKRFPIAVVAPVEIEFSISTNYCSNPLYLTIPVADAGAKK